MANSANINTGINSLSSAKESLTIGDLIKELQGYDPEMELRYSYGDSTLNFSHLWQWDNTGSGDVLNPYITLQLV